MGEWWDQVPLLCPNPGITDGRPVEDAMSSTPVALSYNRPSGEVVFLDNSPSKRGFVTELTGMSASSLSLLSSSGTVLAAAPNGSAETVASAGDVDEDGSANTSGRGANKKNGRRYNMRPLLTLIRDSAVESTIFQVLNCVGIFALTVVLTCLQQKHIDIGVKL